MTLWYRILFKPQNGQSEIMEQLESFLDMVATETRKSILMSAAQNLWTIGVKSHMEEIDLLLVEGENKEFETLILEVDRTLFRHLKRTLRQLGIQTVDDSPIEAMDKILEAIIVVENYGDYDSIWNIINEESMGNQKLAEIVNHITGYPYGKSIEVIDFVNEELFVRLKQIIEEDMAEVEQVIDLEPFIARVKEYKTKYALTLDRKVFNVGIRLGSELETIMDVVESDMIVLSKNKINLEPFIQELIGLVLMSNVPKENILATAADMVEEYIEDLFDVSKVTKKISNMEI